MSDQLVTIATNLVPQEAEMLRGRLQADGIFAVVVGDNVARNMWACGFGAQVMVTPQNAAAALKIKRECERA